jgi:hypothetical protein
VDTDLWADGLGALLLGLGAFFLLRFKKRRFDRKNAFGVETFSSYWAMIGAKVKDALLIFFSLLFGIGGALVLGFNHLQSWGWIVVCPLLLLGVFLPAGSSASNNN